MIEASAGSGEREEIATNAEAETVVTSVPTIAAGKR